MKYLILFFFISCSHLFYHPSKKEFINPKQFVKSIENHWFETSDGLKLHAWMLQSEIKDTKGTIVYFHGNAENITTHFINLAWMTKFGFQVFIFDYRGYGQSEGFPSQKGLYLDSLSALDYAHKIHQKNSDKPFIVFGSSLGGIVSLKAITDWKFKNRIDLIVQDSTFSSYQNIAFKKLKSSWVTFLLSPLAFILVSDQYETKSSLSKLATPLLVISSPKDPVVPYEFSKEIFENAASEKKWFWKPNDGTHTDIFWIENFRYREEFLKLIESIK